MSAFSGERGPAAGQGLFSLGTGGWPLVHVPSFEVVTGPTPERGPVRTAGVRVASIGAARAGGEP